MSGLLIGILNLSISASFAAFFVILIRLSLRKAPKVFSYALWAVVFFRLVCPFTFHLPVSVIPVQPETIPLDIIYSQSPSIQSGMSAVDRAINTSIEKALPPVTPVDSVNAAQIILEIGTILWLIGLIGLCLYGLIRFLNIKRKVGTAIRVRENIYETDRIRTPFVLGFIRAKIYIPSDLKGKELEYVIAHEKTHIRRCDHLIKLLAFFITTLHWFNPIVWISYALMARDMELSADESVMKHYNFDIRSGYANSLLALSARQSGLLSPLAFGKTGVKMRIKNVLNYKKPSFWVSVAAIVVVTATSLALNVSSLADGSPDHVPSASEYNHVEIEYLSPIMDAASNNKCEISYPEAVAYIDTTISTSLTASQEEKLENNHTNQYTIKLSNEIGRYSCSLYYDTLYDKAYLVKDGGTYETGTDFARYIDSFSEFENVTFPIEDSEAVKLFELYGWTLDYQVNTLKSELNNINSLTHFDPNAYYFAYNNELSKDIGLDMSAYADSAGLTAEIYRIHESIPDFYPITNWRGIVIKKDNQIIGAFISAGRHSTFNACSLKGHPFEAVTGQTVDEWLSDNMKADSTDESLSRLQPEGIIEKYFAALNQKDAEAAGYCISKQALLGNLTANMPNDDLYLDQFSLPLTDVYGEEPIFTNLKSARSLKVELIEEPNKNQKIYRVYVNLQYSNQITMENGEQFWDCSMIYESPQTGWKIEGFGH